MGVKADCQQVNHKAFTIPILTIFPFVDVVLSHGIKKVRSHHLVVKHLDDFGCIHYVWLFYIKGVEFTCMATWLPYNSVFG